MLTGCPAGRLELGIGAGWNKPEHDAIGIPFEPVGTRIAKLAVLKGWFGDQKFSFAGDHAPLVVPRKAGTADGRATGCG